MTTLLECFSPAFSYGLSLENILRDKAPPTLSCDEAQKMVKDRLNQAESAAMRCGISHQDIKDAKFAFIAWIDELMAKRAGWHNGDTLQVELFNTHNAGDEFFLFLDDPGNQRKKEVLEIYFLALCLGFIGKYFVNPNSVELTNYREILVGKLPQSPANIHKLHEERITFQPYDSSKAPGPAVVPRWCGRSLLPLVIILALLIPILIVLLKWIPEDAHVPNAQLDDLVKQFQCAQLEYSIHDKTIAWQGYVSDEKDKDRLEDETKKLSGIEPDLKHLAVRIRPYCEVLTLVTPYKLSNDNEGYGVKLISLGHSDVSPDSGNPLYHRGKSKDEPVYLKLDAHSAKFNSYIYVDYYGQNGQVGHIYPAEKAENTLQPRGKKLSSLGTPPQLGADGWEISCPCGDEMIVILASEHPLFDELRESVEDVHSYIEALRKALKNLPSGKNVAADYLFITTEE